VENTRNNAAFDMKYHLVFVTKYRRKALSEAMRDRAQAIITDLLQAWRCEMIEFGGEEDHIHMLFAAHPALDMSKIVNNLKTVSSRRLRSEFADELRKFYWKPVLWHGAYYIGTVGGATLETVKRYVEQQGQDKWSPSRRAAQQNKKGR
jgi:putative transposase